jgi:ketosteroid isomerase-like protein
MMKRTAILTIIFVIIGSSLLAQHAEKEVGDAVEQLKKGMLDGDRALLNKLTSEDLSYGHSSGRIEDKAAFVEALASGKSDFITLNLAEQTVKVRGDVAYVRHKLSAETNDGGKPGTANIGVLLVWVKENGEWKLLARQAFKLL